MKGGRSYWGGGKGSAKATGPTPARRFEPLQVLERQPARFGDVPPAGVAGARQLELDAADGGAAAAPAGPPPTPAGSPSSSRRSARSSRSRSSRWRSSFRASSRGSSSRPSAGCRSRADSSWDRCRRWRRGRRRWAPIPSSWPPAAPRTGPRFARGSARCRRRRRARCSRSPMPRDGSWPAARAALATSCSPARGARGWSRRRARRSSCARSTTSAPSRSRARTIGWWCAPRCRSPIRRCDFSARWW